MEENLKFLITQAEERIKLVDTKASIILAMYGILLSSFSFFQNLAIDYELPTFYCKIIVLMIFMSFLFLVITIRPFLKLHQFILWTKNKNDSKGDWITTIKDADEFKYSEIENPKKAFETLFISISKRRILKYQYFRISMWFLRISILMILPILIYVLFIKN